MLLEESRHAFRVVRTHRAFSAAVVLIMALAIGANTAVFTLVNAVILSPLPFPEPSRLVEVTGRRLDTSPDPFSLPDFRDLRDGTVTTAVDGPDLASAVRIQTCVSAAAGACDLDL